MRDLALTPIATLAACTPDVPTPGAGGAGGASSTHSTKSGSPMTTGPSMSIAAESATIGTTADASSSSVMQMPKFEECGHATDAFALDLGNWMPFGNASHFNLDPIDYALLVP